VLIALAWPFHVHHVGCQNWFHRRRAAGFRTCPITEMGFVRISSHPGFREKKTTTPFEALALLRKIKALPGYEFWTADLPVGDALSTLRVAGHQQITDAYLLGIAIARGGILATLDRGVRAIAPDAGAVEIIDGFAN
jgi:hypothetical protein